eukprot:TRINITY_DN1198_c0_g1_i7.p3 TRINITY_DN1198_c0_g1~~TRINITY_DN1198_c0_g1_i7.p3  ORF type:complete len:275 (+),score=95.38 TRINITY_DN1198_c0_g1_i7:310-1134(+)
MDEILEAANGALEPVLGGVAGHDHPLRVFGVLYTIVLVGGFVTYALFASLAYLVVYRLLPHRLLEPHDRAVARGQIEREVLVSLKGMPLIALLTAPIYFAEWAGLTRIYHNVNEYGWPYFFFSIALFLAFTDAAIYWIHRALHYGPLYQHLHKTHHLFISPTPFAAVAFHPIDGWLQSTPYHLFVLFVPLHSRLYLAMFLFVQLWTISIHDRVSLAPLDGIVNGSAHHACHHDAFNYNYGQYFTLWDRLCGTHREWDGGMAARTFKRKERKKEH